MWQLAYMLMKLTPCVTFFDKSKQLSSWLHSGDNNKEKKRNYDIKACTSTGYVEQIICQMVSNSELIAKYKNFRHRCRSEQQYMKVVRRCYRYRGRTLWLCRLLCAVKAGLFSQKDDTGTLVRQWLIEDYEGITSQKIESKTMRIL